MTKSQEEPLDLAQAQAARAQLLLELGQITYSRIKLAEEAERLENAHVLTVQRIEQLDASTPDLKNLGEN